MLDLEQQLHDYGSFLDGLESEPVVVAVAERNRSRLVAAVLAAVLLVGGSIAVVARRDAHDTVTIRGSGNGDTTTASTSDSIVTEQPTFAQQVKQLEAWYAHAVADAPGGRPILEAEFEVCDYRPPLGTNVQMGFASYFPLAEPLTEARLVQGCLHRDDIPKGTSAPHQLCAADVRGPVYDSTAKVVKLVTKPVVMFGRTDCAAAGYEPFTTALLAEINHRRKVEIEIRAVPRSCPTLHEAADWVVKVTGQELGGPWVLAEPPPASAPSHTPATVPPPSSGATSSGNCVRPERIDWDAWIVSLERF